MSKSEVMYGRCLCGDIEFEALVPAREYYVCHCNMCQKWSSGLHFSVKIEKLTIRADDNMNMFQSSEHAQRGFCRRCGSNVLYRNDKSKLYVVNLGLFDQRQNFTAVAEIFSDLGLCSLEGSHKRFSQKDMTKLGF
ncbi:GFA family protein [Roseibium sediminis]|uniref:GFA family protein n=1 Tax=Roseibium sediminis TaxID=1775174 RepID=UPI00123D4D2A|nr:GFA family protein [Roseibium sediminis]